MGIVDFSNLYPNLVTLHESFTFSDHCPIIISAEAKTHHFKSYPFRFHNFWTSHSSVEQIVKGNWRLKGKGSNMFRFMRKLKAIKKELKPWAKVKLVMYRIKFKKKLG